MPARLVPQATSVIPDASVTFGKVDTSAVYAGNVLMNSTLGVAAASFDLQNIPTGFTRFEIFLISKNTTNAQNIVMRFNNDSGNNYTYEEISAAAAVLGSATVTTSSLHVGLHESTGWSSIRCVVENSTDKMKAMIAEAGKPSASYFNTGYWNQTTEINRITLFPGANNFATGSRCVIIGFKT